MSELDDELYRRLEVGPRASHEDIVRAYRRLAHGTHPDAHPEDPDATRRFRELTEAYDVLADPARRTRYDGARPKASAPRKPPTAPIAFGPAIVAGAEPFFPLTAELRAGPVRIIPDPATQAASPAGDPETISAALVRLLSRLTDERWLW